MPALTGMQSSSSSQATLGSSHPVPEADTIRILVSTDNHVGYNERDAIRGDDSWKTFHEIMCLAKNRDVDMVLLAGDLFHENRPSRKSMYQVMRSIRMNCLGDKPCELEMLSDASENFQGAFDHVNYEDPDINIATPIFSIHGNHDDPSGEANLAALDLLQVSGLINYYGRMPEADNIVIKPVLLQKGRTKLALYGMSNVRDERLFRTFRDGNVRFFQPSVQKSDWFNLMSVHQNHVAHTETGYLPESFLPSFIDLVVWGHEHECLIEPRYNPEMSFNVIQPGSSVATSLMPGEAVAKHVAILSITGKEFKIEPIRLKTVRPFLMREVVLADEPSLRGVAKKDNNRGVITRFLEGTVNEMIEQAKQEWKETQTQSSLEDDEEDQPKTPLPLIRLRVEYTAPEGGKFDCENPQRFSNRFIDKVANVNDVVQFYRKKKGVTRKANDGPELPDAAILAQMQDNFNVGKLAREFLAAQTLECLPQNGFGDSVNQFIEKDDKYAIDNFISDTLTSHVEQLLKGDVGYEGDEDELLEAISQVKAALEEQIESGQKKITSKRRKLKPKPAEWDSDMDGEWEEQPGALVHSDDEMEDANNSSVPPPKTAAARGRGKAAATTRQTATASKAKTSKASTAKAAPARVSRAKKPVVIEDDDDEDEEEDAMVVDDDSDEDEALFVKPKARAAAAKPATRAAPAKRNASPAKKAPAKSNARQTTLSFSQPATQTQTRQTSGTGRKKVVEIVSEVSGMLEGSTD